ncbi:MAG: hypothetical protein HY609_03610 [Deltaproteobacteria bacterium]|nr:hypothetical protein [Deltaproteobacteria bacterium]
MARRKRKKRPFGMKEFVDSVDDVMQQQEKKHPPIKQVHARLSPEWKRVSEKIGRLLTIKEEEEIENLREAIVAEGEIATRVLLDFLLTLVRKANPPEGPPQS